MKETITVKEAIQKIENYCAYQERCHSEVVEKLWELKMTSDEIDEIIVKLIDANFLNEERFACSFARGKHRIKHWGKIRITNELKQRKITQNLVLKALKEIPEDEYLNTFYTLSEKYWETIVEKNILKKRKKFCDYLLRRGFESNLIYDQLKSLENKAL